MLEKWFHGADDVILNQFIKDLRGIGDLSPRST